MAKEQKPPATKIINNFRGQMESKDSSGRRVRIRRVRILRQLLHYVKNQESRGCNPILNGVAQHPNILLKVPAKNLCLPYKTLFPPGIQLYNPPSLLFAWACFARIYKEAHRAVYKIREIPITRAKPPKNFRQDEVI